MKLLSYLDIEKDNISSFAKKTKISRSTIHNILREEKDMSLSMALKIEDYTKGKVTCRDLLPKKRSNKRGYYKKKKEQEKDTERSEVSSQT
jgi:DNA-binding transcriptional regulator YdaS (Cro superfamily)